MPARRGPTLSPPRHRAEVPGEFLHGPPLLQVDEEHRGLDVHGGVVVQEPRAGQRVGRRCRPQHLEHRGRPAEPGRQRADDRARSDQAPVDDHDGLVDGEKAHRREADAEDRDRARGLDDDREQRRGKEREHERIPRALDHIPEPGLFGEGRGGVLDEHEAEHGHGPSEEGRRHGPEPRQPAARNRRAGEAEDVERDDLDVEGDDHDQRGHPDPPPPRISASALRVVTSPERSMLTTMKVTAVMLWVIPPARAPQARAENRFPVNRPAALRRPPGGQRLQVLGEDPHPHDEEGQGRPRSLQGARSCRGGVMHREMGRSHMHGWHFESLGRTCRRARDSLSTVRRKTEAAGHVDPAGDSRSTRG